MKTKVLFLCTGNSCRSQIAEGYLRHLAGNRFEVSSAGLEPGTVNPKAIIAMKDVGIDISHHKSEDVDSYIGKKFDYVITVCDNAKEKCPIFPGETIRIHWSFKDPADATGTEDEILNVFKYVRDQIKSKLLEFLELNN